MNVRLKVKRKYKCARCEMEAEGHFFKEIDIKNSRLICPECISILTKQYNKFILTFFEIDIGGQCGLVTTGIHNQKKYEKLTTLIIELTADDYERLEIPIYERLKKVKIMGDK